MSKSEIADWNNSDNCDTLAAASAEAGNFELAAQWEAKVLQLLQDGTPPLRTRGTRRK